MDKKIAQARFEKKLEQEPKINKVMEEIKQKISKKMKKLQENPQWYEQQIIKEAVLHPNVTQINYPIVRIPGPRYYIHYGFTSRTIPNYNKRVSDILQEYQDMIKNIFKSDNCNLDIRHGFYENQYEVIVKMKIK